MITSTEYHGTRRSWLFFPSRTARATSRATHRRQDRSRRRPTSAGVVPVMSLVCRSAAPVVLDIFQSVFHPGTYHYSLAIHSDYRVTILGRDPCRGEDLFARGRVIKYSRACSRDSSILYVASMVIKSPVLRSLDSRWIPLYVDVVSSCLETRLTPIGNKHYIP